MQWLFVFLLAAARLLPVLMLWPTIGQRCVPVRWRWVGALGLACLVSVGSGSSSALRDVSQYALFILLLQEVLLGLAMALGFVLMATALQLTGVVAGQMSGIGLNDVADPGNALGQTTLERLFGLLSIVLFLAVDGHRRVVESVLSSFTSLPPGSRLDSSDATLMLSGMLGHSFVLGLRAAIPMAFALLFASLVIGSLARVIPQLGSFGFGVHINLGVLLLVAAVSVGALAALYRQELDHGFDRLLTSIGMPLP